MKILQLKTKTFKYGFNIGSMVNQIFKENNIEEVKLLQDPKNNTTVFEIPSGTKYIIGDSTFINGSYGEVELKEFHGETIKSKNRNIFANSYALDILDLREFIQH